MKDFHYSAAVDQFEKKIYSVLKKYPAETVLLAAVSGGADSTAMLTALSHLLSPNTQLTLNFQLFVLHVDHGIRTAEECRNDSKFVRAFCKKNKINFRIKHFRQGRIAGFAKRKGIGIEAAARIFRYKALRAEAAQLKQCARLSEIICNENILILTAHTKDDLLETTLMRVLRGCGPAGLAAMPAEKREQKIVIVRPLLGMTRADVIEYLQANNISWIEDISNTDEKYLRNRIRGKLVPLLDEAFPFWRSGAAAMAQTQSTAAEFIADEAKKRIVWEINNEDFLFTDAVNFFSQPEIIREEAVFLGIDELLKKSANYRSVKRAVVRKFCAQTGASAVTAADFGAVRVKYEGEKILLSRKRKEFFECGISVKR